MTRSEIRAAEAANEGRYRDLLDSTRGRRPTDDEERAMAACRAERRRLAAITPSDAQAAPKALGLRSSRTREWHQANAALKDSLRDWTVRP